MVDQPKSVVVLCSGADKDKVWLGKLAVHLNSLERQRLIFFWHDQLISAGTDWKKETNIHLETASIILLLISADFIASDFCHSDEMKQALERHDARVIPLLIRPVDLTHTPFTHLQPLPENKIPLTLWENEDVALTNITTAIHHIIVEELPQSSRRIVSTRPSVEKRVLKKRITFISTLSMVLIMLFVVLSFILKKGGLSSAPSSPLSSTQTTISLPTTYTTSPSFSGDTSDKATVSAFLTYLCDLLQTGQYQQAFTQLTTTAYQQNNSSGEFSFATFGGVTHCLVPTQANISILPPLYISTDCLIHLVVRHHSEFNHGYNLKKQDDRTWKIVATFSETNQESFLMPQCRDFSTP